MTSRSPRAVSLCLLTSNDQADSLLCNAEKTKEWTRMKYSYHFSDPDNGMSVAIAASWPREDIPRAIYECRLQWGR
jgi:hypothetical protein